MQSLHEDVLILLSCCKYLLCRHSLCKMNWKNIYMDLNMSSLFNIKAHKRRKAREFMSVHREFLMVHCWIPYSTIQILLDTMLIHAFHKHIKIALIVFIYCFLIIVFVPDICLWVLLWRCISVRSPWTYASLWSSYANLFLF